MKRIYKLAAEMYGYSYAHYKEKVQMNHSRFTHYMPEDVNAIELYLKGDISEHELVKGLNISADQLSEYICAYQRAVKIVDAEHAAASYLNTVSAKIDDYCKNQISIEDKLSLLKAIGYATVDFFFLLDEEGKKIEVYEDYLKQE